VRHDAVRAALVAAFHDRDEGADGSSAQLRRGGQEVWRLKVVLGAHDWARAALGLQQQARQLGDVVGPEQQVHVGHAFEQALALLLGNAAGERDGEPRPLALELRDAPDLAAQLLLSLFANTAGVQQDQVGVIEATSFRMAGPAQHLADPLGIVRVHLATEGDDRIASHGSE
jgi:hypothetical protein